MNTQEAKNERSILKNLKLYSVHIYMANIYIYIYMLLQVSDLVDH